MTYQKIFLKFAVKFIQTYQLTMLDIIPRTDVLEPVIVMYFRNTEFCFFIPGVYFL